MTFPWKCGGCGEVGEVNIPDGTSIWDAVELIVAAHDDASPHCPTAPDQVKVSIR